MTCSRVQVAILPARYKVPTIYPLREMVEAGGLFRLDQIISAAGRVADRHQFPGRESAACCASRRALLIGFIGRLGF